MKKTNNFSESDFLDIFDKEIKNRNAPMLTLDESFYDSVVTNIPKNELKRLADLCIKKSWLKKAAFGGSKYANLQLTSAGIEEMKSEKKQQERTIVKKFSDYIENHKGIVRLFLFIVAIITLLIQIF